MNLFRSEFFLSNPIPYPLDSRRKTSQQDSKISGDGGQFKVGNEVFRLSSWYLIETEDTRRGLARAYHIKI